MTMHAPIGDGMTLHQTQSVRRGVGLVAPALPVIESFASRPASPSPHHAGHSPNPSWHRPRQAPRTMRRKTPSRSIRACFSGTWQLGTAA